MGMNYYPTVVLTCVRRRRIVDVTVVGVAV